MLRPFLWYVFLRFLSTATSENAGFAAVAAVDGSVTGGLASGLQRSRLKADPKRFLEVTYGPALQPLVQVTVGGQQLKLVLDASSGNTVIFVKEWGGCIPASLDSCYSYAQALQAGNVRICPENMAGISCAAAAMAGLGPYECTRPDILPDIQNLTGKPDVLIIDGLEYDQFGVEARDAISVSVQGAEPAVFAWPNMSLRLLTQPMRIPNRPVGVSLDLFAGTNGILGASGPTLSCRDSMLWWSLLHDSLNAHRFILDLRPPPNATHQEEGPSRIVFDEIDPDMAPNLVWSEPKQRGDVVNDGMHEFLIYRPELCGVDLLYNTSSNWLAVIDTSGPCLALPPFLFDRLMTHAPVDCPFPLGSPSFGRLCSPRRAGAQDMLPAMSFTLADITDAKLNSLSLPLERLVFKNESGAELLCVARQDVDGERIQADMMYSHVAFGSMVVASFYTVVNWENGTVALASRGNASSISSDSFCSQKVTCSSEAQTFFPPLNVCEDPRCSDYMFMVLDQSSRTCRWAGYAPTLFVIVLILLVGLDLVSHRLYKQAIERASEHCQ